MRFSKLLFSILIGIVFANAKLIIIIRHGEKLNDMVTDLSDVGKARAECLVEIFGNNGVYATPQKIYAQCPTENKQSTRPKDTVTPLANSLGLQVDLTFTSGKFKKLVKDIQNSPEEVVLISWSNDKIDNIAKEFDINSVPKWDGSVFDDVWMITDGSTPYLKNGSNVTPTATYSGKKLYSMYVVKENVDQCMNQFLNSSTQSQNIQNSQIEQQNAQYANIQEQAQNQEVQNQQAQGDTSAQINEQNIISSSTIIKTGIITIVGIICSTLILL
jgi:broad specificity phosphatase PhoE